MQGNGIQKISQFASCLLVLCLFFPGISLSEQSKGIKERDTIPNISLLPVQSFKDKEYLGLTGNKILSFGDIRADFILIYCFSIYCPVCQKHAVKLKKLYDLVQKDSLIKTSIKIIGIGHGNNITEVTYFKEYYDVPFPSIPDPDYKIHKALKETRTPLLAIIDKRSKPYRIRAILDFTKEPEDIVKDIRSTLHKNKAINF